jgi:hypothetical protein
MSRPALPALMEDICFEGVHCTLKLSSPADRLWLATFVGHDVGEFGDAPLRHLAEFLDQSQRMTLFVDGRDVPGASVEVSGNWAVWMQQNRDRLQQVHILCGSRFIHLTANFVKRFAGLEGKMFVYTEATAFEHALGAAVVSSRRTN